MANEYAQFLTPWTTQLQEGETVNTPDVADNYPYNGGTEFGIKKWQDITGQPSGVLWPDPNAYYIECWANTATMDAIVADPLFVLIEETRRDLDIPIDPEAPPVPSEVPTQGEFDVFRLEVDEVFTPVFEAKIWESQQVVDALGTTVDGRDWETINQQLLDYCKVAPKGTESLRLTAQDLGDGNTGFSANPGGDLNPDHLFGLPVARIVTNPALGGTLALKLTSVLSVEQTFIDKIRILDGQLFDAQLAFYNEVEREWVWISTGLNFVDGEDYVLLVLK